MPLVRIDVQQGRSPAELRKIADVVQEFFRNDWIDAPMRPAKRGGAFCAYTVPSAHPYVLLNYTYKRRDVMTLAHELGHGVHAALGASQGVFHMSTPLSTGYSTVPPVRAPDEVMPPSTKGKTWRLMPRPIHNCWMSE